MSDNGLFSVAGKTALVTGGSRGIGLMIAAGLVDAGARVYISSRKARACADAAAQLNARPPVPDRQPGAGNGTVAGRGGGAGDERCVALPADLSGEAGVDALVGALAEREPALHILVNNAGATWGAPLADYPDSGFDKVLAINLKGVFHLTRRLLPALRAAATPDDPARVINIGSVDGIRVPSTENYAYAASKAGLHMLTRQLAHRLAAEHITVNAIAPGPFRSKMMAFLLDAEGGEDLVAAGVPLGRIGRPDDMAGAAVYLASRAGAYLTGAVIPVDGGLSTHG